MPSQSTARERALIPSDIISLLFDQAATLEPPDPHLYPLRKDRGPRLGWIRLTHVCHDWREVGLGLPLLWAAIVTTFPDPSIADELLARARGCPITIDLTSSAFGRAQCREEPLVSWARQHIFQAAILILRNNKAYTLLRQGNSDDLSALQALCITEDIIDGRDAISVLQLSAPQLRSATLTNALLPPSSTRNLRYLKCIVSVRHTDFSLNAIHAFLSQCFLLEEVELIIYNAPLPDDEAAHERTAVRWDKLKRASISADMDQLVRLWEPIEVVDAITLKLLCRVRRDPPLETLLRPLFTICAPQLCNEHHDAVDLSAHESKLNLKIYQLPDRAVASGHSCALSFTQGHLRVLNAFPSFIRAANMRWLSLDRDIVDTIQIAHVFGRIGSVLKGVETLRLQRMDQWPVSLYIRALGQGTPEPIFPALRELRVTTMRSYGMPHDLTRSLTQHWWDTANASFTRRLNAFNMPLRRVILEGMWISGTTDSHWNINQDAQERKLCLERGLVQEIVDQRAFQSLTLFNRTRACD